MSEVINGKIVNYDDRRGGFYIFAPYGDHDRLTLRQYDTVGVILEDGRRISSEQRKKAHALIAEIADWVGELPEFMKAHFKAEFMLDRAKDMHEKVFSLSDCDMTTAREFISYLIDFIFYHGVPCKVPLITLADDIGRYMYAALMNKKCAICGQKAQLHHFDSIGMGRDREEILQLGMKVIPLCERHHAEAHIHGRLWLTDIMHLEPIELTPEIGKVYGLSKKNLGGNNELAQDRD